MCNNAGIVYFIWMTNSSKRPLAAKKQADSSTVMRKLAAMFNLADENERHYYEVIRRAHSGRWPTWRAFAVVRVGATLYEAAQWNPAQRREPIAYSVLIWNLRELGVSWRDQSSAAAACRAMQAMAKAAKAQSASSTPPADSGPTPKAVS